MEAALAPWRLDESSVHALPRSELASRYSHLPTGDLDEIPGRSVTAKEQGTAQAVQVAAARRQAIHSLARTLGRLAVPANLKPGRHHPDPARTIWFFKMAIARDYAARSEARATASLSALADLLGVLAGVEGQKAVVHMSDGLAQRPGMSVFSYLVDQVCPHDTELHAEALSEMLQYDPERSP